MLTVASVNVNGIRAAWKRGMGEWVAARQPDVLLLQEVRAPHEMVGDFLPASDWDLAHHESQVKGRAGVAIATRLPMRAVRIGLTPLPDATDGSELPSDTGRWVEADLDLPDGRVLTVVSTYIHSGTLGTPSMAEKYAYLERVTARLAELRADDDGLALLAGDVNIAHRNEDIKNWKGNVKSAGFLPQERAYLDRWFDGQGWVDLGRRLGGDGPGPFTWWSWRGKAFDNDAGWRIDYQIASPALAAVAVKAEVDRAPSYAERFSDHSPLVVTYEL